MPDAESGERSVSGSIERIVVRIWVGENRMAGTDDPVFLRLEGPSGREFRLDPDHGKGFQRGKLQEFVLAARESGESSVQHPDLNDPTRPAIPVSTVERIRLVKAMNPIPNVRGVGELDDRLLVDEIEVEIYASGGAGPAHFRRQGPIWLGLVCGLTLELARTDGA